MNYKSTLNLPRTDFAMRADLANREPQILDQWQERDIYKLLQEKSKDKPPYILHDGPPYANGNIHIGHALNKTLKDMIIKYKTMQGFRCPFIPGWDCHGLPVEYQLFKELGIEKREIPRVEFRKKAYNYALRFVGIQREEFKRLGVFGDWENPYLTLLPDYEEAILRSLLDLLKKGFIYRALMPVNWCSVCETALAEAEVEYKERISPSIYVKFKLLSQLPGAPTSRGDIHLLIWTTTPWTLAANVAVCLHPNLIYLLIQTEADYLIIAKEHLQQILEKGVIKNYKSLCEFKGSELEGLIYEHPWLRRKGRVVLGDYVSRDCGTGLVHTAPGHGLEDYITGIKYKLDTIMPVDEKGNFDSTVDDLAGIDVFSANKIILEKLRSLGLLLFGDEVHHSYPHCWRCKNPIIFRATKQWFLKIDHLDLRKRLLKIVNNNIQWFPPQGRERIQAMIEMRPDWCLSRQRYWGIPIPAIACLNCKNEFLIPEVMEEFIKIVAKEGSDAWFIKEIGEFLPKDFLCPYCGEKKLQKTDEILDVWFESGASFQGVLKKKEDLGFPCQLYLEGSDQHRGWFQASLIISVATQDKSPFKSVLTHGFVVDAEGRKMSKSTGNVISPQDIIKKYGADILRLWVAASNYNEDIRVSDEILTGVCEVYRKIRNTARFMLSNLYDFYPDQDRLNYEDLKNIDKWILFKLQLVLNSVTGFYEGFEFYRAFQEIYNFCNNDLSMSYLDMIKGRLYTYSSSSKERRGAQTTIYEILSVLVRIIAPITVFTAEDIWRHMPACRTGPDPSRRIVGAGRPKEGTLPLSVHLLDWPRYNPLYGRDDIDQELKKILSLLPSVTEELEGLRQQGTIGSSFDAKIILLTNDKLYLKYLEGHKDELVEIFKVSSVEINEDKTSSFRLNVMKADGLRCARCWNYNSSVGRDRQHSQLCSRCVGILKEESSYEEKDSNKEKN